MLGTGTRLPRTADRQTCFPPVEEGNGASMASVRTPTLVRALAIVVLVLGLVVGATGVMVMASVDRFVAAFSGTESLSSMERSLRAAEGALDDTLLALSDIETLAGGVSSSSTDAAEVVAGAGTLTAKRIPDTLRDVESAMPALIEAAGAVDSTLRALSLFGVQYDPATPFDQALVELDDGLEGLPEQIESQGRLLAGLADHLETVSGQTDAVAGRIAEVNEALVEARASTASLADSAGRLRTVSASVGPGSVVLQVLFGVLAVLSVAAGVVLWALARRLEPAGG